MEPAGRDEPTWVPKVVVLAAQHQQLIEHGGLHGIRDRNALESVLERARTRFTYDTSADLATLAACYAFGIATSHPFTDGNKRAAYVTAAIFLGLNGYELTHEDADIVKMMVAVANGELSEEDLGEWFRQALVPSPPEGA